MVLQQPCLSASATSPAVGCELVEVFPGTSCQEMSDGRLRYAVLSGQSGMGLTSCPVSGQYLLGLDLGELDLGMTLSPSRATLGGTVSVVVASGAEHQAAFVIHAEGSVAAVHDVQAVARPYVVFVDPDVGSDHGGVSTRSSGAIPELSVSTAVRSGGPDPAGARFLFDLAPEPFFDRKGEVLLLGRSALLPALVVLGAHAPADDAISTESAVLLDLAMMSCSWHGSDTTGVI